MPRTPDYQRIVDDITAQIDAGELRHGDRIPSGRQLQRQYGVSSQPVRMALMILRDRGRIQGQQGLAVFVVG
jgi:DNA-binding GntR family transcriptional regulator